MLPHPVIAVVIMRSCDLYVACGCCIQNGELHSSNCFLCSFLVSSLGGVHVSRMLRYCVVVSLRCIYVAACIVGGRVAARACLLCLFLFLSFYVSVRPLLFCLTFVCLACPLSLLSLPVSFSFSASLSPCLSSGNGTNIFKRNAWTQTLARWTFYCGYDFG